MKRLGWILMTVATALMEMRGGALAQTRLTPPVRAALAPPPPYVTYWGTDAPTLGPPGQLTLSSATITPNPSPAGGCPGPTPAAPAYGPLWGIPPVCNFQPAMAYEIPRGYVYTCSGSITLPGPCGIHVHPVGGLAPYNFRPPDMVGVTTCQSMHSEK